MRDTTMFKAVKEICARDRRYRPEAYLFILDALEYTTKVLQKGERAGKGRHVGGRELVEGIRHYALQEFGPMALRVLQNWGLRRTEDFGEVVFNLVASGKLRKTEDDSRRDFAEGYDFTEAFAVPFLPASQPKGAPPGTRTTRATGEGGKRKPAAPPPDTLPF